MIGINIYSKDNTANIPLLKIIPRTKFVGVGNKARRHQEISIKHVFLLQNGASIFQCEALSTQEDLGPAQIPATLE